MITANDLYHRITIEQAKAQLEAICRTYLDTDSEGNPLIPTNRQRPVMLMGPAGIGKTDIPKQTAEKLGLGYVSYSITHHTRQSALGLPKIVLKNYGGNEVSATEYTASEIVTAVKDEIERTGNPNGILFLDEINCASETLSAPLMQLFQNKTLGQSKIPDGWVIIMAGNPPEYNKSVKEFDAVTRDRIRIINVIPDSKAWLEYAQAKNIHPAIISFIKSDPENIYKFEENENSIVTPRGWEELSITLRAYEAGGWTLIFSDEQKKTKPIFFFVREIFGEHIRFVTASAVTVQDLSSTSTLKYCSILFCIWRQANAVIPSCLKCRQS